MNKVRKFGLVIVGLATVAAARAQSTIDLSAVTGGMEDLSGAVKTAAGLVITAGLVLGAIKYGGPWLVGLFKRFTH